MMGRRNSEQGQLFYAFNLDAVVPDDHQVRRIAPVLDLSWLRKELGPHYSITGRPSVDPELMIRCQRPARATSDRRQLHSNSRTRGDAIYIEIPKRMVIPSGA